MSNYQLHCGDCLDVMRKLPDQSIHAIVTDPPYGLSNHSTDEVVTCLSAWIAGEVYKPTGKGFMGKAWDAWVPGPEVWRECLRVLKPGGHMLVFAGTRSMDLMCMAIRLAGFELRDSIGYAHDGGGSPLLAWTFGSGFPKSQDIAKQIDKQAGLTGSFGDYKTADHAAKRKPGSERLHEGWQRPWMEDAEKRDMQGREYIPATATAQQWQGWGTALKPAFEPVILARKPIAEKTIAANVLEWGTGGLNIDATRIDVNDTDPNHRKATGDNGGANSMFGVGNMHRPATLSQGRWPANFVHDGSEEVVRLFPVTTSSGANGNRQASPNRAMSGGNTARITIDGREGDTGSAARFFYTAKADKIDRNEGANNNHPTVKPVGLMVWLCKLVTPPDGTILDPFCGSGSTGKAAMICGFNFIGIDIDPQYIEIARARIEAKDLPLLKEIRSAQVIEEQPPLFEATT